MTSDPLTPLAFADTMHRLSEPFSYRRSWPGGKRWTVCDGSGFDDDIVDIFDTEAEAAAAVKVANGVREDALLIAATLAPAPAPARDLTPWLAHRSDCASRSGGHLTGAGCTCGLAVALAGREP